MTEMASAETLLSTMTPGIRKFAGSTGNSPGAKTRQSEEPSAGAAPTHQRWAFGGEGRRNVSASFSGQASPGDRRRVIVDVPLESTGTVRSRAPLGIVVGARS